MNAALEQSFLATGNPYLRGPYAPVGAEVAAVDRAPSHGEVPRDLDGVYLRNGPNPRWPARGRHHWFDGDGMLHGADFRDGRVTYRNRWIRTRAFGRESAEGRSLWPGLMERPDRSLTEAWGADRWLKDSANTDVKVHGGRALATFYQCGVPYQVDATSLETVGPLDLARLGVRSVSAHSRADERTGEFLFFDYAVQPPYMTYGVLAADGSLAHHVAIDLPGPRLPHDMAFTERYAILMDLPLFWDPALLHRDIHKVTFFPDLPSRFGILPRRGAADSIRWFEAEPGYVYHVANAWEDGDEIVMDGCRMQHPEPAGAREGGELARMLAWLSMDARLYRWRFNLRTGATREEWRDDRICEFPTINASRMGQPTRHAYGVSVAPEPTLRFDGLLKYDSQTGRTDSWHFAAGHYASEAPFAPRTGAREEDDGYLVTFVTDATTDTSELQVFDARQLSAGPVARVPLPQRVPAGFHACWAPRSRLAPAA
jgi:carotenoid cleavage dioxygenase